MSAKDFAALLARLVRALRPYRGLCVVAFVAILVDVAYGALSAMSFGWLLDKAILPRDASMLWTLVGALAGAVIVASAVGVALDRVQVTAGARVANDTRRALFAKLCDMSIADVDALPAGDFVTRFSSDLTAIEVTVGGALPGLVRAIASFVSGLVLLFVLDVRLGAISAVLLPLCLVYTRVLARRAGKALDERRQAEAIAIGAVEETLTNQESVKALSLERTLVARFLEKTSDIVARSVRAAFLGSMVPRSSAIGVNLLELTLLALLSTFAFRGLITVGTIVAFHALFVQTSLALLGITQIIPALVSGSVGFQRIDELLEASPKVADPEDATPAPLLRRRIDFLDVRFGYDKDFPVLDGVTLSIGAGESVAIVGPSGSGKSTLASLLLRFHDPDGGEVRFDGVPLSRVTQRSVRDQMGFVMQSPVLFDATLRDNVRFGRLEATDAELEAACREAGVNTFLHDLPQGLDTPIGRGGVMLSGGQLQRVALARALLRDPRVLLLDEATSALDPTTEASVMASLVKARKGRAVVFITHRLPSVTDFDRIVVMEDGKVVEEGRHQELLDRGGLYKRLWGAQGVQLVAREIRGPASRHLSRPPPPVSVAFADVAFPPTSARPSRL